MSRFNPKLCRSLYDTRVRDLFVAAEINVVVIPCPHYRSVFKLFFSPDHGKDRERVMVRSSLGSYLKVTLSNKEQKSKQDTKLRPATTFAKPPRSNPYLNRRRSQLTFLAFLFALWPNLSLKTWPIIKRTYF